MREKRNVFHTKHDYFTFQALLLLLNQHGFLEETCDFLQSKLLVLLNVPGETPSSKSSANELNFIKKTLQLLLELKTISQMTIVELMTQYTLGTPTFRFVRSQQVQSYSNSM